MMLANRLVQYKMFETIAMVMSDNHEKMLDRASRVVERTVELSSRKRDPSSKGQF